MADSADPKSSDVTGGKWSVLRQDDTGNQYLVKKNLSREEAEQVAKELESHGHKQIYWVERQPD